MNDKLNNELNDELDDEWILSFDKEDKFYKDFYKSTVDYIDLFFIYINKDNEIIHINKKKQKLIDSVITKEMLIYLISKFSYFENSKYKLKYLLQYNIDLIPEDIYKFIDSSNNIDYLKSKKHLDDIKYTDTINFLKNINSLYIVYNTKPIANNSTKKIYINKKKKKRKKTRKRT
tara:strand:+ start:922 stop:1446 length:525 start_codon:yes stop_codon:yes gene_type:complete